MNDLTRIETTLDPRNTVRQEELRRQIVEQTIYAIRFLADAGLYPFDPQRSLRSARTYLNKAEQLAQELGASIDEQQERVAERERQLRGAV